MCNSKALYGVGVIIGAIYLLLSLIVLSGSMFSFLTHRNEGGGFAEKFPTKIVISCLLSAFISALFIYGILMKQPRLMILWFLLSIAGFFYSCIALCIFLFILWYATEEASTLWLILSAGLAIIGIEIVIFWFSYRLYREIRNSNNGDPTPSLLVKYEKESQNNYANI